MTDMFTVIRRLRRIPRQHRIAHLQALIRVELPRSQRRRELEAYLKNEMLAQLRAEGRAA